MKESYPNEVDLAESIRDHYQRHYGQPPAIAHTWAQLAPHLSTRQSTQVWWKRLFAKPGQSISAGWWQPVMIRSRISLAVLIVVCVLLFTTVAYAASAGSVLDTLLRQFLGTKQVAQEHLYTDLNLSKSIDGYTLTINKAYADQNHVVLGYTINSPTGKSLPNIGEKFGSLFSTLKTQEGINLPPREGMGSSPNNVGISGLVISFDASSIQGKPRQLNLQMRMPYGYQPQNALYHVQGWLTYDFTVPYHPGRTATIQQSQISYGQTVTLDHIVVTQSEIHICVRGLGIDFTTFSKYHDDGGFSFLQPSLSAGKLSTNEATESSLCDNNAWGYYINNGQFFTQHGTWTLTLRPYQKTAEPLPATINSKSSWTFHFTVPEV